MGQEDGQVGQEDGQVGQDQEDYSCKVHRCCLSHLPPTTPRHPAGSEAPAVVPSGYADPLPRTVFHVFCDDIDGLLGDHRVQPDQPLVLQLLHEIGFCQEGVRRHAALLQALHGHLRVPVVVP